MVALWQIVVNWEFLSLETCVWKQSHSLNNYTLGLMLVAPEVAVTCCFFTLFTRTSYTQMLFVWQVDKEALWAASWQNQQNGMCVQRRLRSAWASAQSDQSLRCAFNGYLRTGAFFMRTRKTRMPRLIRVFAGRTCHFVGFVTKRLLSFRNTSWNRLMRFIPRKPIKC